MTFHVLTIFPGFFDTIFDHGVVGKAVESAKVRIRVHNLRDWAFDRHRTVDDRPFGGGEGMVLKAEPVFRAVESIFPERGPNRRVALLSAQGKRFDQTEAGRLSGFEELLLICGRYEGVDERVAERLADEEISIGDYVLSGGELPAALVVDAVSRLLPGVLGNEDSSQRESFSSDPNLLDCPQYTRPEVFRGWKAPEPLLGGNHAAIEAWRKEAAREKTRRNRPDLIR